ncbi:MAG: glycosyltransferase [Victivallaceae bacterium]|nr:glycosyltransferase [Victivallaceae bacterium]
MANVVTIYTRYGRAGASSRLRFYDWLPRLEGGSAVSSGNFDQSPVDDCRDDGKHDACLVFSPVRNFFPDCYLKKLYAGDKTAKLYYLFALLRRGMQLLRNRKKPLWLEYELLPFLPWRFEKIFLPRRYVVAFDDNVWEKYRSTPLLSDKFDEISRHASGVIVANEFLQNKVQALNRNILLLPTVLEPSRYRQEHEEKFKRFTLIWIGTPITYRASLAPFQGMLRKLAQQIDFELLIVAGKSLQAEAFEGVPMRFEDWSPETETTLPGRCHVGIMPLPEDEFSQGKSAYKLLQYQAAGLPLVASPVGENRRVVQEGVNGFTPATEEEWIARLQTLSRDEALCKRLGQNALANSRFYSFNYYRDTLSSFLNRTLFPGKENL